MNNKDILLLKEIIKNNRILVDEMFVSFDVEKNSISNSFKSMLELVENILKEKDCPYCKENKTDSIDPNVLCPSCRRTFGHSFFNELWKENKNMYNNLVYVIGKIKEIDKDIVKIKVKKDDKGFNIITCQLLNMSTESLEVDKLIGIRGFLESDENDNIKVIVLKLTHLPSFEE